MLSLRLRNLAVSLVALAGFLHAREIPAATPKIDKSRIESYVRYAEGFMDSVKMAVDDPEPSPFPGYYRLLIHLTSGTQKVDRVYYLDARGGQLLTGSVWNLNSSPFLENLQHLPSREPSFGPAAARITLVVFSDFQCPYCRQFARTIRDNIPKNYPNDVRVLFADFPLDAIHPWARKAAEAAHCIGDGNPEAFWAYHDWVFQNQGDFNLGNVADKSVQYAKDKGLDVPKVQSCLSSPAVAAEVQKNYEAGLHLQVQQTPTVFLNGRMLGGAVSWNALDQLIRMELNRPKEISSTRVLAAAEKDSGF